jgi:hypothetical protein
VQLNTDQADVLDAKTAIVEKTNAVSLSREGEASEAISTPKPRIAWLVAILEATEEVFKRPLQPSYGRLCRGKVEAGKVGIGKRSVLNHADCSVYFSVRFSSS